MASNDSQPDSDRDETRDESTTNDSPTAQAADQRDGLGLSRRATLASLIGISGLSLTSSSAAARKPREWQHDQDADGHKLFDLGTLAMQANSTEISSFEGTGLAIDENGILNVTVSDTRTGVSNDSTEVVADVEDIDFAANLAVTDDGDGSVTVDADTWDSRVDADGNDIVQIGGLQTLNNKTKIKDFEGKNLTIDGSNVLNARDTRTDVSDGGTTVENVEDIDFGANLDVTDDGDGSVTVDAVGDTSGVGASVFLTDSQFLGLDQFETVEFDSKVYDDQSEFDTNTHTFTPEADGTYHVDSTVTWPGTVGEDAFDHRIVVNGNSKAHTQDPPRERTGLETTSVSKMLRLNKGDAVTIQVKFFSGRDLDNGALKPDEDRTYATFTCMG